MSELVDQISRLESKAHALKENVSPFLTAAKIFRRLEEV